MNIESYIVVFIKKHGYCNLPGIGNFQMRKNDKGEKIVHFSNQSIIDDYFASFIGVNENVSTNKATNAISEYAKNLKTELKEGKTISISGLGKFVYENEKIGFVKESDDTFLKPMDGKNFKEINFGDYVKLNETSEKENESNHSDNENTKKQNTVTFETETYNPAYDTDVQEKRAQKNTQNKKILKAILTGLLLLAIVSVLIWAFVKFVFAPKNTEVSATAPTTITNEQPISTPAASTTDTTQNQLTNSGSDTALQATASATQGATVNIVVNAYDSQLSADLREKKLKSFGWEVGRKDDTAKNSFIIYVKVPTNNTPDNTKDSVKRLLNPSGNVYILTQ